MGEKAGVGNLSTIRLGAMMLAFFCGSCLADNLATCLDGRYPALCNHQSLSSEAAKQTQAAEHRANLSTCLDGKYPSLCRHQDLSSEEAARVSDAEHRVNLMTCLDGKYPALCRHGDLAASQVDQVRSAEHRANLTMCLDGRYAALCRHDDLQGGEIQQVAAAEARAKVEHVPAKQSPSYHRPRAQSYGCDTGHWVSSVMDDGRIVKLEDGTLWEIDSIDRIDTALWLPTTDITVCNDKLIDTEDNETAGARHLH